MDSIGFTHTRVLLADTGAGPRDGPFEIVLSERDCLMAHGRRGDEVGLGGAIRGSFDVYQVNIEIPALKFSNSVAAVGVPADRLPDHCDGIASYRFLNSFTFGNFGEPNLFGLETS